MFCDIFSGPARFYAELAPMWHKSYIFEKDFPEIMHKK